MPSLFTTLSQFEPTPTQWLWEPFVPAAGVTLFESFPGCFKTFVTCDIAARVSTGRPMPLSDCPSTIGNVVIFNSEDPALSLQARLRLAGADLTRIAIPTASFRLTFPNCLPELARLVADQQLRLIVIDPLASFAAAPITADVPTRRMMDALSRFSQQHKVAIVCVRHWTKSASSNPTYRGAGSHSITAAARSELIVGKCTSGTNHHVLAQLKSNLAPIATSIAFEPVSHADGVTINWIGDSPLTAHDQMNAPSQRERPAIEEAKRFLVGLLGDGAVLAKTVKSKAADANIAVATLRRAKDELSIASRRRGFGPESVVFWELPPASHPAIAPYWAGEIDHLSSQLFHGDEAGDLTISPAPKPKPIKPPDDGEAATA